MLKNLVSRDWGGRAGQGRRGGEVGWVCYSHGGGNVILDTRLLKYIQGEHDGIMHELLYVVLRFQVISISILCRKVLIPKKRRNNFESSLN